MSDWDDDFEFDAGDVDPNELDSDNVRFVDKNGTYHIEVSEVVPDLGTVNRDGDPQTPRVKFIFTVLETVPGQSPAGSRHIHSLYVAGKGGTPISDYAREQVMKCGLRMGVLKQVNGKIVNADGSTKFSPRVFSAAVGKQLITEIRKEDDYVDNQGRQREGRHKVNREKFWQVDDPAVADVPKDRKALEAIGKGHAATPAAAAAGEGGARSSAPTQKPDDLPDDF